MNYLYISSVFLLDDGQILLTEVLVEDILGVVLGSNVAIVSGRLWLLGWLL